MNLDDRKLILIWEDILQEYGGKETVDAFKKEYSPYSVENLLNEIKSLLKESDENHPCRYKVFIGNTYISYKDANYNEDTKEDTYTIIYSEIEIDYKELLVSLVTLMSLINIEDRPRLIVELANSLRNFDREVSDQFANDIAEEVYRLNR